MGDWRGEERKEREITEKGGERGKHTQARAALPAGKIEGDCAISMLALYLGLVFIHVSLARCSRLIVSWSERDWRVFILFQVMFFFFF